MTAPSISALACPRCNVALHVGNASGLTMHGCGGCGGIWLDTAGARKLSEKLPADAIALAGQASSWAKVAPDTNAPAACPVCKTTMKRSTVAAARLELDACSTHGTWYDRDELTRVAQAIRGSAWGGAPSPAAQPAAQPAPPAAHASTSSASSGVAEMATEGVFAILFGILLD